MGDGLNLSGAAGVMVISYPKALLSIAQSLIGQGHFNVAIVTSHMACEVASERAFAAVYAAKSLMKLGEAVDSLMNGHNLGNDRHRKLYDALAGGELGQEPFWANFKAASEKRNGIVHRGEQANQAEAESAVQAATDLCTHLKQL
jgi:hypothetical protein